MFIHGYGSRVKLTIWGILVFFVHTLSAAPVVSSATPNAVAAGSPGYSVTVQGSGFVQGSVVDWAGTALATTFVSATQLSAAVPASLLTNPGQFALTVNNPDASMSNAVTTTVNPVPTIGGLAPSTISAGSPALTLIVAGYGFVQGAVVQWNGS